MRKLLDISIQAAGQKIAAEVKDYDTKFGPCMRQLNERHRRFVLAMVEYPAVSQGDCAKIAGYQGDTKQLAMYGSRIAHDAKVSAAIKEEATARLSGAGILASTKIVELLGNSTDPTVILKCASMIFDRIGMPKQTRQDINVNHGVDTSQSAIDRIAKACIVLGVDPKTLLGRSAPVVDAEFTEVEDDDLEDFLV